MSFYTPVKHYLKLVRWRIRRIRAAQQYGPEKLASLPMVFGNAMPKSGSHLLTQILEGLTALGPFINPGFPPVNRNEDNQPLHSKTVLRNLETMRPGDVRYGYIHSEEPYLSLLTGPGWATVFIYRDPRDMIVSHVFYATEMNSRHGMHAYYTQKLSSMEERINAAILGVSEPGFELASVRQRYNSYRGWLDQSNILCLKYEDLVLDRESSLGKLLDYIQTRGFQISMPRSDAIHTLMNFIQPKKSGTFRKGIPGNWRDIFTDANKTTFYQATGDLLEDLGYERDGNG